LSPDERGTVGYDPAWLRLVVDMATAGRVVRAADQIEAFAKSDWAAFVKLLFPRLVSVDGSFRATLVMPEPPADVAEVLRKAGDLPLKVAAVAGAIAFKETPSELYSRVLAARVAELRALRDDPIIYYECGEATAVLAQFGDFPVEKQVVDRIVTAEAVLRWFPDSVSIA